MYIIKMRLSFIALGMMCIIFLLFPAAVFGFDMPEVVKVGLESKYKEVSSVTISNQSLLMGSRSDGEYRLLGVVSGSGRFSATASSAYFVEIGSDFVSFDDALGRAEAYRNFGYNAALAFKPNGFAIYAGPYSSKTDADAAAKALEGSVASAAVRVIINDGNSPAAVLESGVQVSDAFGGAVNLGERQYRGAIEFIASGSTLTAVNVLTIDEYLYSAVPSEMPSTWHTEALKAQAVAARTYASTILAKHKDAGYNFCDRVHCQNYLGAGNESESGIAAVNATAGIMAYYNGEPINAVYHSSSGGYTENSESTWTETVPYLRAVDDSFEVSGMKWERTFTLGQIQNLLDVNIGTVTKVYIGKTASSGRVQELVIQGTSGTRTLVKEEIRTFFSASEDGTLESRNFYMQGATSSGSTPVQVFVADILNTVSSALSGLYGLSSGGEIAYLPSEISVAGRDGQMVYSPTASVMSGGSSQGNTAVFTGRGWGHGVGMSQYGAKDMAEAGFDYIQILKHYYTGIEVR